MDEAVQLLISFILAIFGSFALYWRRSSNTAAARSVQLPILKVRDAAVARQTLIDQAVAFANRPATPFPVPLIGGRRRSSLSHGLTTVPYGPHWRGLRSVVNAGMLQPWRQGLLAQLQQEPADALVASLWTHVRGAGGGRDVPIRDSLYHAVFTMLARMCFGDSVDDRRVRSIQRMIEEFRAAIGEARFFSSTMAKLRHWRRWRQFLAFRSRQGALFGPLIEARRRHVSRQNGGGDCGGGRRPYVDFLIEHRIPDENNPKAKRALTEDEMVSMLVELFGVAEATVTALEWTLAHLVNEPEVQAKLRRELAGDHGKRPPGAVGSTYLDAVVLEGLRLHPPFPVVMREVHSSEDAMVVGTTPIPPAGMRVQFVLGDIGKDKSLWTDPDQFKPERFLPGGEGEDVGPVPAGPKEVKMMPFGAGQRACAGAAMGVQFIKTFLAPLVRDFEWTAAGKEGNGAVDMTELYGFMTVMKSPLRVHITPCA